MSEYSVVEFDLSTPRGREIIPQTRQQGVATVSVIQLPSGATASVAFGSGKDLWPLLNQGMQFKPCPAEHDGVYFDNPEGGGVVILGVTYE